MATAVTTKLVRMGTKAIGELVTNTITDTINTKTTHSKRIHHIKQKKLAEGEFIPNVYGKVRLPGSILWMSDVNEYIKVQKKRSKGAQTNHSEYTYTISLAIGLCEGVISSIGRIWADGVLINKKNIRMYYGTDDQEPDPLLEALYDDEAPAFEGIAYAVIQEFDITEFGKVPEFVFEITKVSQDEHSIESLVESMVIIPGCGEFVYDTNIHSENTGDGLVTVNQHHTSGIANSIVSLNQLQDTFTNVKWVAPVVSWFSNSLSAGDCKITPKVEKQYVSYESDGWEVAGIDRKSAETVLRVDNTLNYGGTPSDGSIVRYLQHIKSQGLKVMFYPMIFVDIPGKPWRGRISANSSSDVNEFFNGDNGYNKFILHYANLVKDYADAFLIGSEMQELTKFKDENGQYKAVEELTKLAGKVKEIVGDKVKVSYGANWGEYHSVNGEYYMDKLWASKDIDFVGIDAYFPITDVRSSQYNVKEIISGWDSGELYDYYYDGDKKMPLSPQYAIKNIEFWWNNKHYNPDGKETEWEPQMKKIWFTEYGFASVSCSTNEPNVFVDRSTTESNLPKHSTGDIDFLAQRVAIEGTELRWKNSAMVENKFLWTWDARPYPTWPQLKDVWSDGENWSVGHWINGKSGGMDLRTVVKDICVKSGVEEDLINVEKLNGVVHGLVLEGKETAKSILSDLQKVYNFNLCETDGKITFVSNNASNTFKLNYNNFLANYRENEVDFGDIESPMRVNISNKVPGVVSINYISHDFTIKNYNLNLYDDENKEMFTLDLPLVMSEEDAENVAENIFRNIKDSNTTYSFSLAINSVFNEIDGSYIQPGDILKVAHNDDEIIMRVQNLDIKPDNTVKFLCVKDSGVESYNLQLSPSSHVKDNKIYEIIPESVFEVIKVPNMPLIAIGASGFNDKWFGCQIDYTTLYRNEIVTEDSIIIKNPTTIGRVVSFENNLKKDYFAIDNHSRLVIKLHYGQLFSLAKSNLFTQDKNMIIVGDEIMKFSNATLQEDGTYVLSGLLRGLYGSKTEKFDRFILLDKDLLQVIDLKDPFDKINLKVKTFLDKKPLRVSDIEQERSFTLENDLLHPVKLTRDGNKIKWTPRAINDDFFTDKVDHGFCIRFTDDNNNIIKQLHTMDFSCELISNNDVKQVMVAAFKDNKIRSEFISLKL